MTVVWRLGHARVEEVRQALPGKRDPAYTTVQTVMNRLVERGLLKRKQKGNAFVYEARYDEASYLARSITERLEGASPEARRGALVSLVGELDGADLDEVAKLASRIRRERGKS